MKEIDMKAYLVGYEMQDTQRDDADYEEAYFKRLKKSDKIYRILDKDIIPDGHLSSQALLMQQSGDLEGLKKDVDRQVEEARMRALDNTLAKLEGLDDIVYKEAKDTIEKLKRGEQPQSSPMQKDIISIQRAHEEQWSAMLDGDADKYFAANKKIETLTSQIARLSQQVGDPDSLDAVFDAIGAERGEHTVALHDALVHHKNRKRPADIFTDAYTEQLQNIVNTHQTSNIDGVSMQQVVDIKKDLLWESMVRDTDVAEVPPPNPHSDPAGIKNQFMNALSLAQNNKGSTLQYVDGGYLLLQQIQCSDMEMRYLLLDSSTIDDCMFTRVQMTAVTLAHAHIRNTHFAHMDFANVCNNKLTIENSRFANCVFGHLFRGLCISKGSYYEECVFEDAVFQDVHMENSHFHSCRFVHCTFQKTKIQDIQFTNCRFDGCQYMESTLQGVTYNQCTLHKNTFTDSRLTHITCEENVYVQMNTFSDTRIRESQLCSTTFEQTCFVNCMMQNINTSKSKWENISINNSKLHDNACTHMQVKRLICNKTLIESSDFSATQFLETQFTYSSFHNTLFQKSGLYKSEWIKCIIDSNTNFLNAFVAGSIFEDAVDAKGSIH